MWENVIIVYNELANTSDLITPLRGKKQAPALGVSFMDELNIMKCFRAFINISRLQNLL